MEKKYTLPTVSGLRVDIAFSMASYYRKGHSWMQCYQYAVYENLFQMNKLDSAKRYASYETKLLKSLEEVEIDLLVSGSMDEKNAIVWLAFCRTFPLVGEFSEFIIGPHIREKRFSLNNDDWTEFFLDKAEEYPYLSDMSVNSIKKGRAVVFHNLKEVEYLSSSNELREVFYNENVKNILGTNIKFFPVFF